MEKRGPKPTLCSHGILGIRNCKKCQKELGKRWRVGNKAKVINYFQQWKNDNPEKRKEVEHKSYKKHRRKRIEYIKRWYNENPLKRKAQQLCQNHPERYPLKNKCELCPDSDKRTEKLQRHHPDYDYPHIYVTVCSACHYYADRTTEEIK